MSNQLTDRFTVADQDDTPDGSDSMATVSVLYRGTDTPRNITPHAVASYASAPPPVTVPYGWRMIQTQDGWLIQRHQTEWNVICRAVEGRRAGRAYQGIAQELEAEGAPVWNEGTRPYAGTPRWHPERVRRLVGRYAPELQDETARGRAQAPQPSRGHRVDDESDEEFERMLHKAAELMEDGQ